MDLVEQVPNRRTGFRLRLRVFFIRCRGRWRSGLRRRNILRALGVGGLTCGHGVCFRLVRCVVRQADFRRVHGDASAPSLPQSLLRVVDSFDEFFSACTCRSGGLAHRRWRAHSLRSVLSWSRCLSVRYQQSWLPKPESCRETDVILGKFTV